MLSRLRPTTLMRDIKIEDPNLILTMKTDQIAGKEALELPHNIDRYVPPNEDGVESREVTPYPDLEDNNATGTERIYQLRLTFDRPPKNIGRGFAFGTDKKACDVLLAAKRRQGGISGIHFFINFDERGRLVLIDESTQGTAVSYDGWGRTSRRRQFKWTLFPNREMKIQVHLPNNFILDVVLATHQGCEAQYRENVTSYLEESRDASPPLGLLDIQSQDSTALPTEPLSPRSRPIYLPSRTLGRGSFGKVVLVTDVSTANVYAAKIFREGTAFQNEVRIMRSISHKHIVPFVDFVDERSPLLIMEYLSLGNLKQEHKRNLITPEEAVILLFQCLQALDHLHANNVTHRDLKPANILVESRDPFRVKLCDFGFAKLADNDTVLRTFCGTYAYCAPEIYLGGSYSPAVDLWSLGVIILEYAYGYDRQGLRILDKEEDKTKTRLFGFAWCQDIVKQVNDWDSDSLIDLLSAGVLKIQPNERLSAAECLGRVKNFEPSVDPSFHPGSTTPRTSPVSGDEGGSTIIMGRLWDSGGASNNTGNRRSQSSTSDGEITEVSALQKRPRSPSGSSTPKASDVQPKRLQRSNSHVADAGSETPIQNGTQSDHNYIFDALWNSEHSRTPVIHSLPVKVSTSTLGFPQTSRNSGSEKAERPEGHLTGTVGDDFLRPDTSDSVQEYTFGDHQYRECMLNNVPVRMRVLDKRMCFTHLAQAAGYKKRQIQQFLSEVKDEMKEPYIHHCRKGTLIDYNLALEYIDRFDLAGSDVLSRMINGTEEPLRQQKLTRPTHVQRGRKQYEFNGSQYRAIFHKDQAVYICAPRKLINATQLFKAAGYSRPTVASTIQKFGITIREVIRGSPAYLQGTYVDYDDYLGHFSFLGLDAAIIPQLEERMEAEGEMEDEEEETDEEKKETNAVADSAENAGDLLQLQPSTAINPYPRTYNQNGCIFYPTLVSGTVIYLCPANRLVNASHLIKAAGYRRQALRKKLETYQISVAQQVTGHHKIQGSYLIYDDGLALLQYLGLEAPVDLFAYADCSVLVFPGREFALGKCHDEKTNGHHGTGQAISRVLGEESESRVAYESSYRSRLVQVFPRLSVPASDRHLGRYSAPSSVDNMDRNLSSTSDGVGGCLYPRPESASDSFAE